jgi:hypothetical protein
VALVGALLVAATAAAVAGDKSGSEGIKEHARIGVLSDTQYKGGVKAGSASNMEAIAHVDLGARGYNADVWFHEGYAYVGQWGFGDWATGNSRFCPSDDATRGVAIVDARTPASARWVARLVQPANTSIEDVVVFTARFGPLAGRDIAVGGLQTCISRYDIAAERGLMFWDVTNPASPVQIGYLKTACCTRGVHELEVQHRADLGRTFAYASVPTSRYPDPASLNGVRDVNGDGDFRLFDITNPTAAFQVSEWAIQDAAGWPFPGYGCDQDPNYGHSAEPSADGKLVFFSYWDSGFVALNLTNPANPVYEGRTVYAADEDGDAHSSQYDEGRRLLFSADEDFCNTSGSGTEKGYGYLRVWDYSNRSAPTQIGEYKTPNTPGGNDQGAGDYTIHNNYLVGTRLFTSWYTDGVRMIDVSNPRAPKEIGYFVPPATTNPVKPSQRGVLTNTTQVWGVVVDESTGLVYASDMNSGLWILRPLK